MSILSSERFYSNSISMEVVEAVDHVEIFFFPSAEGQLSGGYHYNNATGAINFAQNGQVIWGGNGITGDPMSSKHLIGLYFYMNYGLDGQLVLKAIKKEITKNNLVATTGFIDATHYAEQSDCIPHIVTSIVRDPGMLTYIQSKILNLASRYHLYVDPEFAKIEQSIVAQYNGIVAETACAYIDWLAYPLVREINSAAFARNLTDQERYLICPNFKPMKFKELVEHYYGTSTGKLLEEVWKVITVGGDYRRTNFQGIPEQFAAQAREHVVNALPVIDQGTNYVIQVGNRCLQDLVFTLGPAIHKTLGFDYLYQFLPKLASHEAVRSREINSSEWFVSIIQGLMKFISPKRLIHIVSECRRKSNVSYLRDTVDMLGTYSSPEKIPASIRDQYPNGLVVDFKFKELKELHDKVSTQYTIIKAEADKKEIPIHELFGKLEGRELNGLKLVVPTNTTFLAIWGKLLNICVASYGDRAARGETLLLGAEREGQIKYCIEFRSSLVKHIPGAIIGLEQTQLPIPTGESGRPLPRLVQKELVNPQDQSVEMYYIPSIIQFRSERNGDPTPEDKDLVHTMLTNWVQENLEEFKKYGDSVIYKKNNGLFGDLGRMVDGNEIRIQNNGYAANDIRIEAGQVAMQHNIAIVNVAGHNA